MTLNTVFEQVKKLIAPEVKVEQSVLLAGDQIQIQLTFIENLMGSPAEHRVYRHVLQQRLEKLLIHLRTGQAALR